MRVFWGPEQNDQRIPSEISWPYLLLILRGRFNFPADEFLALPFWQAQGYLDAIPYVLDAGEVDGESPTPDKNGGAVDFEDFLRQQGGV